MARPDALSGTDAASGRIEWVRDSCRLLGAIGAEFGRTRPFDGLTIGTGIHLEPKTVALLLTLVQGGAVVVSTGNLSSTNPDYEPIANWALLAGPDCGDIGR